MKKVAIVGLGWLGMPLAMSLAAKGWQVTGSKTTADGVEAARMCGIDGVELRLEPELVCDAEEIVVSALALHVPRMIFTSSTSVYGDAPGVMKEGTERRPVTASGKVLKELEDWLHNLPGTQVDIVRLAGLVGPGRHPGRFFAGKSAPDGQHVVNLVHLEDVIGAIELLLKAPKGGHIYNICAPSHPARSTFYPLMARQLGLAPPVFAEAKDESKGKIVDGNRICHELGFEYQYPDPLVMPME